MGASKINHYDAKQNLIAKAVWLAKSEPDGGGGAFYNSFTRTAAVYSMKPGVTLVRFKNDQVVTIVAGGSHSDDGYEKLSRGLAGYNQGASILGRVSWLNLLMDQPPVSSVEYQNLASAIQTTEIKIKIARSKAVEYAISTLHYEKNLLQLPYRQYIWRVSSGTRNFCFAYGEADWATENLRGDKHTYSWAQVFNHADQFQQGENLPGVRDPRVECPQEAP